MEYKEFLKVLGKEGIYSKSNYYTWAKDCIYVRWSGGGVGGGSCWSEGDDYHYSLTPDPVPEFDALDKVIEMFWPNISFIQYKRLCQELVESGSEEYNEYYGNSSITCYKKVNVEKLYNYLKEKGAVE